MGIFNKPKPSTSTVKPMTMGGGNARGSGKNQSPRQVTQEHFSAASNSATRSLAKKYSTNNMNGGKSLSKFVAGTGVIKDQ